MQSSEPTFIKSNMVAHAYNPTAGRQRPEDAWDLPSQVRVISELQAVTDAISKEADSVPEDGCPLSSTLTHACTWTITYVNMNIFKNVSGQRRKRECEKSKVPNSLLDGRSRMTNNSQMDYKHLLNRCSLPCTVTSKS